MPSAGALEARREARRAVAVDRMAAQHGLQTDPEADAKAAGGDPLAMGLLGLSEAGRLVRGVPNRTGGAGRAAGSLHECER